VFSGQRIADPDSDEDRAAPRQAAWVLIRDQTPLARESFYAFTG
jgi:hypothetical protein